MNVSRSTSGEELSTFPPEGIESSDRNSDITQLFHVTFSDVVDGVTSSRLLRAILLAGGAAAMLVFLASNPLGWAMTATAMAVTVVAYITFFAHQWTEFRFEITAIPRLIGFRDHFNRIKISGMKKPIILVKSPTSGVSMRKN